MGAAPGQLAGTQTSTDDSPQSHRGTIRLAGCAEPFPFAPGFVLALTVMVCRGHRAEMHPHPWGDLTAGQTQCLES